MDIDTQQSPVLAAALRYAEAGVAVFPVRLYVRGDGRKGVQPIADWDSASSTDARVITGWFTGAWSDAALAIDCGKSGLVGIDQDVVEGKDGVNAWQALNPPATWRAWSPTGGIHDYYRADPDHPFTVDNDGAVAEGVDVRGMGGFMFAPPSVDPRGGAWRWVEGEPEWAALPMVPEVVIKRMGAAGEHKRPKAPAGISSQSASVPADPLFMQGGGAQFGPGGGYKTQGAAVALLTARLAEFASRTEPGSARSHFLAQDLGVLAGHGVGVFWTYESAHETLMEAARGNGMVSVHGEAYVADQARRGLEYGMRQPWIRADMTSRSAGQSNMTGDVTDVKPSADAVEALLAEMLSADELAERPAPRPLIKGLLSLDSIAWLIGAPGSKKSFVALSMAAHIARGMAWQGLKVHQGAVVLIVAEGAGGMSTRVKAWQQVHGQIGGVDAFRVLPRPVQVTDEVGWAVLVEACRRIEPVLVVIDTQARVTVGMEENSAKEMGVFIESAEQIRKATGACVTVVHHTGRNGADARGSSAIDGAQSTELKVVKQDALTGMLKVEKQKDLEERAEMPLFFDRVVVGQDGDGDELSSLVLVEANEFRRASGQQERPTVYVPTFHDKDVWRQRILDALYLHAPDGGWLLSDLCGRLEKDYGVTGLRRTGAFTGAWKAVLALTDPDGDLVITRPSPQRFEVGSLSVRAGLSIRYPDA